MFLLSCELVNFIDHYGGERSALIFSFYNLSLQMADPFNKLNL